MMKRTAAATALALTAAAGVLLAAPAAQHSYLVTVIPETDGPVTTLTAADFVVREGSKDLRVVAAEHSTFPLAVSLLVDTSLPDVIVSPARELRAALAGFVARVRKAGGNARIALVEVAGGAVTKAGYDAPAEQLDAAVETIFPAHPADMIMLEAIGQAARGLTPMQTPRRAIVTVDFNSSESATEGTMKRVMADLGESGATVWAVSLRLPRANSSKREAALNIMTKDTGGMRLVAGAPTGLDALLARVADSLASQYIVTFERDSSDEPGAIEMRTTQGLKVHVSPMRR